MNVTLAVGNPPIIPELPIKLKGWKKDIVEQEWITMEITHVLDDSGLVFSINLEKKNNEL